MTDQHEPPPAEPPAGGSGPADGPGRPEPTPGWAPIQPPLWTAPTGADPAASGPPTGPYVPPGDPRWTPYSDPGMSYGGHYSAYAPPPAAPKPGIVPLRPLGLGEILDGAVAYIRGNPRAVLGVSVVLAVAAAVLELVTNLLTWGAISRSIDDLTNSLDGFDTPATSADTSAQLSSTLLDLVASGISLFIGVVATGLFTILIGHAVLGRRIRAGQAWAEARGRLLRLLGLTLLIGLVTIGIFVAGVVVAIVLTAALGGVGLAVGALLVIGLIPLAIWLWVSWSLAAPTLMLERTGVIVAMRRSFRLVRPAWWRIFGIELLAAIIAGVITTVVSIPFTVIGGVSIFTAADPTSIPWLYLVGSALGSLVAAVVVQPFSAGVTALLYVDQRIRREALDLVLLDAANVSAATYEQRT